MSTGVYTLPAPVNEPVRNYAPGTPERASLKARLADPEKNWKFNPGDLDERKLWKDYQRAYEDALRQCSTKHAPWFVVPANKKWFRNLAVSQIIVETLAKLDPQFPKPVADLSKIVVH